MENRDGEVSESEAESGVRKWLTVPGRLLLIFWICSTVGMFVWWFETTFEGMPAGEYPLMWWTMPALVVGGASFFLTAWMLERLGVKIYRRDQ